MRIAIRLLTATMFVLFVVAIGVAQVGVQDQAQTTHTVRYIPGLLEILVVDALLALTMLLFTIASILGLVLALQLKEQQWKEKPWAIAIILNTVGVGLIYLGILHPRGFLLPVVRAFLPHIGFSLAEDPLLFVPALLGAALLIIYSFRTLPDPRLPLYMKLGGRNAE